MDDHSDNEDARPPVEASQFYLDADEDDIIADTFVPNTQTLELLQVKKTRVDFVSFSKTAKRVDVQKLKSNIWKELTHDEDGADTQAAEEVCAQISVRAYQKRCYSGQMPIIHICRHQRVHHLRKSICLATASSRT